MLHFIYPDIFLYIEKLYNGESGGLKLDYVWVMYWTEMNATVDDYIDIARQAKTLHKQLLSLIDNVTGKIPKDVIHFLFKMEDYLFLFKEQAEKLVRGLPDDATLRRNSRRAFGSWRTCSICSAGNLLKYSWTIFSCSGLSVSACTVIDRENMTAIHNGSTVGFLLGIIFASDIALYESGMRTACHPLHLFFGRRSLDISRAGILALSEPQGPD